MQMNSATFHVTERANEHYLCHKHSSPCDETHRSKHSYHSNSAHCN